MYRARRVIVGSSGSPRSIPALRRALDVARQDDAMLIAVHAWVPPDGDLAERRAPSRELRRIWADTARERLETALGVAWGGQVPPGLTVRALVARGEPGLVLVDTADSADDLLVIGAGRRGRVGRVIGGRVSRYCLAHAVCPVLAVPPPALGRSDRALRHGQLTVDQVLRESGHTAA